MIKRKQSSIVQGIAAVLIVGGIAVAWMSVSQPQTEQAAPAMPMAGNDMANAMAPDFALPDLEAKTVKLSDFDGQVRIVDFWATWCPPCRREMPSMERLYRAYLDDGFVVVAVSIDRAPTGKVEAFVKKLELSFPVLHDRDERVARLYGIPGVPASYVIGARGRIAYRAAGEYDWFRPAARSAVEGLLRAGRD